MTESDKDACLADATHAEYVAAQEEFPGFVDDDGNPTDDDITEGDAYVSEGE